MIEKVYRTIREHGLIQKGDKIVIGLSGGADSVCLTHILYSLKDELGIELLTAHLNHNIRGTEAQSDASAAQKFSESLGIPFVLRSENVIAYSEENGISEELAGRELRYAFFDELMRERGFNKIATAHNRNDNAETILMNFVRGSGIKGLSGIPYKRGEIIRPVLDITREEIERYCYDNSLAYVTDSTNNETIYTRNKIRLELIPKIKDMLNPNFINTVTENARIISEDEAFIVGFAMKEYSRNVSDRRVSIEYLTSQPFSVSSRIVFEMMRDVSGDVSDFSQKATEDVLELARKGKSGASVNLPKGITARIEYGRLCIDEKEENNAFEYTILPGTEIYIKEIGKTVRMEYVDKKNGEGIYFAAAEGDTVAVRSRRDGDVFFPTGMEGRKKLKDFFVDMKIPRNERNKLPIVTINGEIAGIVGKRYDRRFVFNEKGIKITII